MKTMLSICFCMVIFFKAEAQKIVPNIKEGSTIKASAIMPGGDFPIDFKIVGLLAPTIIAWDVEGYGQGTFEMTAEALQNGNELYLSQPAIGVTKLDNNQTFLVISKNAFKAITDDKIFTYNKINFSVKPSNEVIKVNNVAVDAVHLLSEEGKIEVWILNNQTFPIVLKSKGLPIDIVVNEIN